MEPRLAHMLVESIQAERRAAANRQVDLRAARSAKVVKGHPFRLAMRVLQLRPA